MKLSRFSCLLVVIGGIACGKVELERPIPGDAGAGANAGTGASAGAGADAAVGAGAGGPGTPELTLGNENVDELLSDGTRLYWLSEFSKIRGCIALSCAQSVVTYGNIGIATTKSVSNRIRNFDFTEQRVVWRAPAGISSCPKSGCGAQETLLATDSGQTWWGLSASDSDVYWSSDLDIYRCADTGCDAVPSALVSGETTSMKLVFWGPYAYWNGRGGIRRAPRDGSEAPTTIIASASEPADARGVGKIDELGIDAEHLYWHGESSHILSCPIAGCDPEDATVLVPTEADKRAFQVDASGLYWIDDDAGGAVVRCPLTGCTAPVPVTAGKVYDFTLDETSIYWSSGETLGQFGDGCCVGGGTDIHRNAKPNP